MSFIKKKLLNSKNLSLDVPSGYSQCNSFNYLTKSSKLYENAEYIIVGTLTPKQGRDIGYFYCSPSKNQRQFELIDLWKNDGLSLNYERKCLANKPKDLTIIKNIEAILAQRRIAFVDVIKEAIASIADPSDEKIIDYVLDYDFFEEILDHNSEVTFIANSKNAYVALKHILNTINKTRAIRHIPQNPRCVKGGLKTINELYSQLL